MNLYDVEAELIRLRAEIESLKVSTYCAYCGHAEPIDGDGGRIAEHIRTCEKHPMRQVEVERDRYRAALLRLAARAENYSPADVVAAVADALGIPLDTLEKEIAG